MQQNGLMQKIDLEKKDCIQKYLIQQRKWIRKLISIQQFYQILTQSSMNGLKKVMWEGTEHWDQLLKERMTDYGSKFTVGP